MLNIRKLSYYLHLTKGMTFSGSRNNRNKNNSISKSNNNDDFFSNELINHRLYNLIEYMRNFRINVMNPHENFCHVASIFRENGKEQYFKLRYGL